jgi:hypothetical protein
MAAKTAAPTLLGGGAPPVSHFSHANIFYVDLRRLACL